MQVKTLTISKVGYMSRRPTKEITEELDAAVNKFLKDHEGYQIHELVWNFEYALVTIRYSPPR